MGSTVFVSNLETGFCFTWVRYNLANMDLWKYKYEIKGQGGTLLGVPGLWNPMWWETGLGLGGMNSGGRGVRWDHDRGGNFIRSFKHGWMFAWWLQGLTAGECRLLGRGICGSDQRIGQDGSSSIGIWLCGGFRPVWDREWLGHTLVVRQVGRHIIWEPGWEWRRIENGGTWDPIAHEDWWPWGGWLFHHQRGFGLSSRRTWLTFFFCPWCWDGPAWASTFLPKIFPQRRLYSLYSIFYPIWYHTFFREREREREKERESKDNY